MDYFAIEQIGDRSEVDVRVWANINTLADAELCCPHMGCSTVEVAAVHLSVIRERHDPSRRGRIKRSPTQPCFRSNLYKAVEILVPVFARVVVIATGEFEEHARRIAHRPRIVTRWQQHDIVL